MKIHWHNKAQLDEQALESKLEFEYTFRKKVLKFLIKNDIDECCDDYNCIVFDYFVDQNRIEISNQTPEPIYSNFLSFWDEIRLDEAS